MPEPGSKPAGSGFIAFKPISLSAEVELIHKLQQGNVDLQFRDMGEHVNKLKHLFESVADADMRFARASKSGCIRLQVPPLNTAHEFNDQKEACFFGIKAATRLLGWYEQFGRNYFD